MLASWNNRKALLAKTVILTVFLIIISIGGILMEEAALETDFSRKNLSPCFKYLFGTDIPVGIYDGFQINLGTQ